MYINQELISLLLTIIVCVLSQTGKREEGREEEEENDQYRTGVSGALLRLQPHHPVTSGQTSFPSGRLVGCLGCQFSSELKQKYPRLPAGWAGVAGRERCGRPVAGAGSEERLHARHQKQDRPQQLHLLYCTGGPGHHPGAAGPAEPGDAAGQQCTDHNHRNCHQHPTPALNQRWFEVV